jgi:hypothetical protein
MAGVSVGTPAAAGGLRRRQLLDFQLVGFCLLAAGIFAAYPLAYLCVVIPAILPLYFWIRAGTPGIPTLPIVAGLSVIYYAAPALRGDLRTKDADKILAAELAVAAFLLGAAVAYRGFLKAAAQRDSTGGNRASDGTAMIELTFFGLAGGIVYDLMLLGGWLDWLGAYIGVVRAIGLTFGSIGCYLAGAARADGSLRGTSWAAAVICVVAVTVLAISSLLLVGGVASILAAIFGYVVRARRIPWLTLVMAFGLVSVLQAGKPAIRDEYWEQPDSQISISEIPEVMFDWFEDGVRVLWSGAEETDVLDRASLLWTVIRVQEMTPGAVPYLNGETYALLSSYLVPRFVDPDKAKSQAGLNLLGIRYGLQSEEGTARTTIGFGLVAEAYANFGSWGTIAVGALFGALCGIVTWLSAGTGPTSLRMFLAIAATTVLMNVEADLSYLLVTLLQALAGVLIAAIVPIMMNAVIRSRPGYPATSAARGGGAPRALR